jgi:glycosyltransferase involved in cell wall biosynthesis
MIRNPFRSDDQNDLVVIDSQFPQKDPLAFRNAEINEYIKRVQHFSAYAMYPMSPDAQAGFGHSYGVSPKEFKANKKGYLGYYPKNASKIHYLQGNKSYNFKLAFSFFLGETYVLLPFYEAQKIPFVFVLYPGGLFGLDSRESDYMLRKICGSPYFRAVITTQEITREYLRSHAICSEDKIRYVYGGIAQFTKSEVEPKKKYGVDKNTFDICFVAAKYSERGVDKGYDLFIDSAKKLAKAHDDIRFHVVGGFDATDVDVSMLDDRITFYGYKRPDFLRDFYARMDIYLSPNRPFMLFNGNFDGFPLGNDAGYCGVALFVADELKMNHEYAPDEEIVIIPLNAQKIVERILEYYSDPKKLYALSLRGQAKSQRLFDVSIQVDQRLKVFSEFSDIKLYSTMEER